METGGESVQVAPIEEEEDEDLLDEGAVRAPRHIRDISQDSDSGRGGQT